MTLLAAAFPLSARGRQDTVLSRADSLIAERRYDEAIQELTTYLESHPEDFARIQQRLQAIIKYRDNYNNLAEELLYVLEHEPENTDELLRISNALRNIEINPNPMVQDFIDRTREVALFASNRNQLERILADGRALIDAGRYPDALARYSEGFSLYLPEFHAADYGSIVINQVDNNVEEIERAIGRFNEILGPLNEGVIAFERQGAQTPGSGAFAGLSAAYDRLKPRLLELMELRNTLATTADYFQRQQALLQETHPRLGDSSFLPFATRLVLGRSTETVPEGMLGIMDTLWDSSLSRVESVIARGALSVYNSALARSEDRRYDEAREAFPVITSYDDLYMEAAALENLKEALKLPEYADIDGIRIAREKAGTYLDYYSMKLSLPLLGAAQEAEGRIHDLNEQELNYHQAVILNADVSAETVRQGSAVRDAMLEFSTRLDGMMADLDAASALVGGYQEAAGLERNETVYLATVRERYAAVAALAWSSETDSVIRSYSLIATDLGGKINSYEEGLAEAARLLAGVSMTAGGAETAHYPREASTLLDGIVNSISGNIQTVSALSRRIADEDDRVLALPEMEELSGTLRNISSNLDDLLSRSTRSAGQASSLAAQAESYRLDGDRLYQEARTAFTNNNFDLARDRLTRTEERYDASLEIQESDSLRALRDQRLLALDAEITRSESEIIVREVRQLVTQARAAYFRGEFEQAEEMLSRAQDRWRRVYTENDSELEYWLGLVRNAVALRSGRFIPVTAPLYSEMSQLLSEAHRSYDEGIRLISQGRRSGGLESLSRARQKTEEVKLVFPVNQDASLLQLRIAQVVDPENFPAMFRDRFNNDMALIRQLRQAATEQFADLQDLAAINPRYPGIQAALNEAEILIGLRPPPPDPAALARSRELTLQAQQLMETAANSPVQMEIARGYVNQALNLNPNNEQAIALKNTIVSLIGGTAQNVLTAAAEQEFKRAQQEFTQGRYINAYDILQRLLEDSRNKNVQKVIDLERRTRAML
ncbi:MAG: hypothetical protein LBI85_07375 [Spirochaetaceae bacterium]|jgi:hypothetical protein|nr:hypothetical protein [Spirochaetaceae bacterium]